MADDVKLHGLWSSPFTQRVIWALQLKGLSYEYIAEDIICKSESLVRYNPVHKKVPVLVHGGKPVTESMLIVEYIDETWAQNPLLPQDAHERAVVRFWAKFIEEKSIPMMAFFRHVGEDQEKAINFTLDTFKTIEENGLGGNKFLGSEEVSLADIALGWIVHTLPVMEDIIGVKLVKAETFPLLHEWMANFKQVSVIKSSQPDYARALDYFRAKREMFIKLGEKH
ncbi:hypothetical protein ACJRO7_029763 [Eucalyptus globulus]|uniref:Glutathione S-transferase n=1 Tax=Eucalyptus globulus TaxID=34317 RepID=A0ABD3JCL9_EUCGL